VRRHWFAAGLAVLASGAVTACADLVPPAGMSTTRPASASPSRPPGELSYATASSLGLVRRDALGVSGPDEVRADRGGRATVVLTVTLPVVRPDITVQVDRSGDCMLVGAARSSRTPAPYTAHQVTLTTNVTVPPQRASCLLTVDVIFPGKAYTGAGFTTTLRA